MREQQQLRWSQVRKIIPQFSNAVSDFNSGDKIDLSSLFDVGGELAGITNPLGNGYVEAIIAGGGTLIQVDFDPGDTLQNKNVVYLEGYTTAMTAADFIF